jgi:hypothetical protein
MPSQSQVRCPAGPRSHSLRFPEIPPFSFPGPPLRCAIRKLLGFDLPRHRTLEGPFSGHHKRLCSDGLLIVAARHISSSPALGVTMCG